MLVSQGLTPYPRRVRAAARTSGRRLLSTGRPLNCKLVHPRSLATASAAAANSASAAPSNGSIATGPWKQRNSPPPPEWLLTRPPTRSPSSTSERASLAASSIAAQHRVCRKSASQPARSSQSSHAASGVVRWIIRRSRAQRLAELEVHEVGLLEICLARTKAIQEKQCVNRAGDPHPLSERPLDAR